MEQKRELFDIHRVERGFRLRYDGLKRSHYREDNKKIVLAWINKKRRLLMAQYGRTEESMLRIYKTLLKEIYFCKNVLAWFDDKPLFEIGVRDIKRVYMGLETDELTTTRGKKLTDGSKKDYYEKVFKAGFFRELNKAAIAKKVILRRFMRKKEPRFFTLEDLRKMVPFTVKPYQRVFMWTAFDSLIEVGALLQLKKSDFTKPKSTWIIHPPLEVSKKGRRQRNIPVYFKETNDLLDSFLKTKQPEDRLFPVCHRYVYDFISEASEQAGITIQPSGGPVMPKDFRSSGATHYLVNLKWNMITVKARMGHSPSSTMLDVYISYFGLDQEREMQESREREETDYQKRYDEMEEKMRWQQNQLDRVQSQLRRLLKIEDMEKKATGHSAAKNK